jgi:hypothetical protein
MTSTSCQGRHSLPDQDFREVAHRIFFCNAKFCRYRGTADIDQAALIQRRFYKHAPLSEGLNPCWEPER